MQNSAILYIYSMKDAIWMDPPYQRQGDIWPIPKRQLLIDSIINGYDLPKLYFHEYRKSKTVGADRFDFAVIDGKQRLQSIFQFIAGGFSLHEDTEYLHDKSINLGGLTYQELAREYPNIKIKFDSYTLPIFSVQTEDLTHIEEMFSRLNEAVPLNAAEKRNARPGPIPPITREHSSMAFFKKKLPFDNTRYRHFELSTKFLYIEHRQGLFDTKKAYLDEFVNEFTDAEQKDADALGRKAAKILRAMASIFTDEDSLLKSTGMVVLYYYLFHAASNEGWLDTLSRKALSEFESLRKQNREIGEKNETKADYRLLEFDRFSQSPNDAVALQYRYAVLRQYVGPAKGRPSIPGTEP
ncbi:MULTISPECIES: DUF262 domain-containing protein [unclassified Corallococcus]|uniref:DUF262 domain-containing protein n=1 Tax=unclassified Corallococcus TaxID=2685029 RepID=UPI001A9038D6|nr:MULTISPECIES: DUF262 domain-containing protein [unclassified Corallococcus]MBN9687673.1 DUF262 domain-containing protein [Corallococcus sp. NCSPR001]WAS88509.1 DUF262 domain-containing protein [Corallococcus sp. NCRR]